MTRIGFGLSVAPEIMSSIIGAVLSQDAEVKEGTDHCTIQMFSVPSSLLQLYQLCYAFLLAMLCFTLRHSMCVPLRKMLMHTIKQYRSRT